MRPFLFSLIFAMPGSVFAEPAADAEAAIVALDDFRLGGAATRSAIVPTTPIEDDEISDAAPRLSLPLRSVNNDTSRAESALGAATFFVSEGFDDGRDALELGTYLSRGQARAGLSVTYLEDAAEVARSELFLDYALNDRFSVGLSGILDSELSDTETVPQLGLNAEFSTNGGAFVQGGVAGASDYDPVIGLSVGLRF